MGNSMDDGMWKDLGLSSLPEPPTATPTARPRPSFLELDFLSSGGGPSSDPLPPPPPPKKRKTPLDPENAAPVTLDRRRKRMIMNRESASRSRARKQAYVNELERNVKVLKAENAMLKFKIEPKLQEMLAHSAQGPPKKHGGLTRTTSSSIIERVMGMTM